MTELDEGARKHLATAVGAFVAAVEKRQLGTDATDERRHLRSTEVLDKVLRCLDALHGKKLLKRATSPASFDPILAFRRGTEITTVIKYGDSLQFSAESGGDAPLEQRDMIARIRGRLDEHFLTLAENLDQKVVPSEPKQALVDALRAHAENLKAPCDIFSALWPS